MTCLTRGRVSHRAPEVLTLHLKRFQQDMRGRLRKISGSIPFPADLDITPFCDPKVAHSSPRSLVAAMLQRAFAHVSNLPSRRTCFPAMHMPTCCCSGYFRLYIVDVFQRSAGSSEAQCMLAVLPITSLTCQRMKVLLADGKGQQGEYMIIAGQGCGGCTLHAGGRGGAPGQHVWRPLHLILCAAGARGRPGAAAAAAAARPSRSAALGP